VRPTRRRSPPTKVCGFTLRDHLPPTYPHVLAFPLHMAVMADGSFPFGAVGLVHVENRIVQHRPIGLGEELRLASARPSSSRTRSGRTFSLVTEAGRGESVWERVSTMLRRGGESPPTAKSRRDAASDPGDGRRRERRVALGGDLGRRYAAVSGDRNPIHMHSLTAKPLGFPARSRTGCGPRRAAWRRSRAACPTPSPSTSASASRSCCRPGRVRQHAGGEEIAFAVRDAKRNTPPRRHRADEPSPTARGHSERQPTRDRPSAAWASACGR
jgi:acyl dehydratase